MTIDEIRMSNKCWILIIQMRNEALNIQQLFETVPIQSEKMQLQKREATVHNS